MQVIKIAQHETRQSFLLLFSEELLFNSILSASLAFPLNPSSLAGSWRIFRGRWLQVAPATTSRNPLSLPRQPSPSSSHPLLSPGDSIRQSENESEGRKGERVLLVSAE